MASDYAPTPVEGFLDLRAAGEVDGHDVQQHSERRPHLATPSSGGTVHLLVGQPEPDQCQARRQPARHRPADPQSCDREQPRYCRRRQPSGQGCEGLAGELGFQRPLEDRKVRP